MGVRKNGTQTSGDGHTVYAETGLRSPGGLSFAPAEHGHAIFFLFFFPSYLILPSEEVKVENPKERMQCCVLACPVLTPLLSKPKQYFFNPGRKPFLLPFQLIHCT